MAYCCLLCHIFLSALRSFSLINVYSATEQQRPQRLGVLFVNLLGLGILPAHRLKIYDLCVHTNADVSDHGESERKANAPSVSIRLSFSKYII